MTDGGALYGQAEVAIDDVHNDNVIKILDEMDVTDFESALGIAIDEIERMEAANMDPPRTSAYNTMLDHIMSVEKNAFEGLMGWSKMTGEYDGWKQSNHEIIDSMTGEQRRLIAPVQESMNKAIEFQMKSQELLADVSVNMEYVGWIRSILSALIKSIKRVITQT